MIIKIGKNRNLEKLFRENKTSPLLKTPEKDFQLSNLSKIFVFMPSFDIACLHLIVLLSF